MPEPNVITKVCRACGEAKPQADFPFRKDKQKFTAKCKSCVHARQAKWLSVSRSSRKLESFPCDLNEQVLLQRESLIARMRRHTEVNPTTGCWEYVTAKRRTGYPLVMVKLREGWFQFGGHRLIAGIENGLDLLNPELFACHHCDNRCCWNPAHIFVGTSGDNQRDAAAKGRMRGNEKLSSEEVLEIRRLRNSGLSRKKVAELFSVNINHVSAITAGRCRRGVK